jgi:hypothetical protein
MPAGPDERGRVPLEGMDGWSFLPFEESGDEHRITLERDDGVQASLTLPEFVVRGDELSEIARLVARARDRWDELKGLGA